jgi:hypothetical protein
LFLPIHKGTPYPDQAVGKNGIFSNFVTTLSNHLHPLVFCEAPCSTGACFTGTSFKSPAKQPSAPFPAVALSQGKMCATMSFTTNGRLDTISQRPTPTVMTEMLPDFNDTTSLLQKRTSFFQTLALKMQINSQFASSSRPPFSPHPGKLRKSRLICSA